MKNVAQSISPASAPMTSPLRILWPPWRFGRSIKSASDEELDALSDGAVISEWGFASLVVLGVIGEFVIAAYDPPHNSWSGRWGLAYGDLMVAIGVAGEVVGSVVSHVCQGALTRRSNDRLTEANRKLTQLAQRVITKEQFDEIQTLRGSLSVITVACVPDAEASLFAMQIEVAFAQAGITVEHSRLTDNHFWAGEGLMVYDPDAYVNRNRGIPTHGEPLVGLIARAKLAPGAMVRGRLPEGLEEIRRDIPALIVMKKHGLPATETPWWVTAAKEQLASKPT